LGWRDGLYAGAGLEVMDGEEETAVPRVRLEALLVIGGRRVRVAQPFIGPTHVGIARSTVRIRLEKPVSVLYALERLLHRRAPG